MGAHGTCEEALANVSAFRDAANQLDNPPPEKRHKSSKRKRKDKSKDKHRKKHKKSSKHKRFKHTAASSSSSGSSSDDNREDAPLSTTEQLARGKQACETLRHILIEYPAARAELREVLRRIDKGESVDIAGIPDAALLTAIRTLFHNLCLRCTSRGLYSSSSYHDSALGFLAHVFEEDLTVVQLPAPHDPPQKQQHADDAAQHDQDEKQQKTLTDDVQHVEKNHDVQKPVCSHDNDAHYGVIESDDEGGDERDIPVGPTVRVVGPAMPSAEEMAAAAAEFNPLQTAAGGQQQEDEEEEEEQEDFMVGPPPPDFIVDMSADVSEEQAQEIKRILEVLSEAQYNNAVPQFNNAPVVAASGQGVGVNPYAVLGVGNDADKGTIKKRYWRLSLLIHPDKCTHPKANDAFQAVGHAAKQLQDEALRSAADKRLEDQRIEKATQEMLQQQERARQWRVARGQATAEDLRGPVGPAARDTWMTDLPIARSGGGQPSQTSVRSFSIKGVRERGDTSGWTSVAGKQGPLQLQAAGPALLTHAYVTEGPPAGAAVQQAVAAFNQGTRKKTLVEQHQERLQKKQGKQKAAAVKQAKGATQASKEAGPTGGVEWEGKHPWRPFDRDRDLQQAPKNSAHDVIKKAGNLSSRFSSSGGP